MRILDRYLAASILLNTLLVLVVLIALFTFVQFVDALGDIGKQNYQLPDAIRYVLLSIPRQTHEIFPMAALLGTTLGLASLAADSELVAMRAAGVSVLRIVRAAMQVGLALALIAVLIGEYLVPYTEALAETGRAEALKVRIKHQKDLGLWMRDGQAYVQIGEVLPDLSLLGVDIYQFGPDDHLTLHTTAKRGRFEDRQWRLSEVRESQFKDNRVESRRLSKQDWSSTLTPDLFQIFTVRPEGLSIVQLYRYIQHLDQNRQNTGPFALSFWQKIVAPFATVVMMVLAIPFVFTSQRSGGVGARLFIGIVIGLAFFVVSRGFGYFGLLYGVPAFLGAVLPTLLFFGATLVMLRRVY